MYGDMDDSGLDLEKATPAARNSGRDLEKLSQVLSRLQESASNMDKPALYTLQQAVGLYVADFNRALLRAIQRSPN